MNAYQHQLLDKLINELTDNASPNLHAAQMLAAELKGAMQAQDAPTQPITPTLDDGWVENTGVDPECVILSCKMASGHILNEKMYSGSMNWKLGIGLGTIIHYRPA